MNIVRTLSTVATCSGSVRRLCALTPLLSRTPRMNQMQLTPIKTSCQPHRTIASTRSFSATASIITNSSTDPHTPIDLHSLDFPYLKSDPVATAPLDYARGTSVRDAPILILHGLLGSAGNWRTTAPKLSSHRRILSLDVRNHGASHHINDMRFRSCAEDVIRLMDRKGIQKAIVMGHSLGGKIAMAAGLLHPDRILSVISVDMAPQDYHLGEDGWTGVSKIVEACASVPMKEMHSRTDVDRFLKPLIPDFTTRAFVLQNVVVDTKEDKTGEKYQTVHWRCNLNVLHQSLPLIAGFELHPPTPLQPYPHESLFIGGGKSPYLTSKQHQQVKQLFPDSNIVTIPDAGHWVHVEKTKEFIDIVKGYLLKLEGSS